MGPASVPHFYNVTSIRLRPSNYPQLGGPPTASDGAQYRATRSHMDDRGSPTEEPPCDVEMTSQRDAGSPPPRPDKMPVETSAAAIATPETNEAYHAHPQEPRERRDSHGALPARGPDLMITDHAPVPRSRLHHKYACVVPIATLT